MKALSRLRLASFSALTAIGLSVASLAVYAQATPVVEVSDTLGLNDDVSMTEVPVEPLTSTLQPTTPWPVEISGTQLSHNLLAFSGVDEAAKKLVGRDYAVWKSHFAEDNTMAIPNVTPGIYTLNGCLKSNCDLHKSLLVVSPASQKVYAAMVTDGKMSMWPSLMSWPDESIPVLKTWLADATDNSDKKK